MSLSNAEAFALLPEEVRDEWLSQQDLKTLQEIMRGEWWWLARPEQIPPPGDWLVHLALAGRGWGKSKSGSEWLVEKVLEHPYDRHGTPTEWLVIAETLSDAKIICVEGPAGILRVLNRRKIKYHYVKSPKPMIVFLDTGSKIYCEGADDADVGRGYNAAGGWCIAEGEPILTRRGVVPVEEVIVGDEVMTRDGWRSVRRSGLSARKVEVLRIETKSGTVRLTGNHRVMTQRGWVRADEISVRDSMYTCIVPSQSQLKPLPTTSGMVLSGTSTSVGGTTPTAPEVSCTDLSGRPSPDQSPMDMKSIISIGSPGIIRSVTWNASQQQNIVVGHGPTDMPGSLPARLGFADDPLAISSVTSVALSSQRQTGRRSDVVASAVESRCADRTMTAVLRVVQESIPVDVYDLSVEGTPEFYAGDGSLLVHNCDEIAKWKKPKAAWFEGIMPSLRADLINDHPRVFVTTTPKPVDILREWVQRTDGSVSIARGSTFDNASNLSQLVVQELKIRYEGTAIGRQELYGELLEALEGALFSRLDMENGRVWEVPDDIISIGVGVDPNLTGEEDEMGVIVVGRSRNNHMYVLADRSCKKTGLAAALHCWEVVAEFGADVMLYESNLGKAWMKQVLEDAYLQLMEKDLFPAGTTAPMRPVDSKLGKKTRAEPVALRVEQRRIHMVGRHPELETQCAEFIPDSGGDSPDRMDAFVHVCRHFMQAEKRSMRMASPQDAVLAAMALMSGQGADPAAVASAFGNIDSLRIPDDWSQRYGG